MPGSNREVPIDDETDVSSESGTSEPGPEPDDGEARSRRRARATGMRRNVRTRWEVLIYAIAIAAGLGVGYLVYTGVLGGASPFQPTTISAADYRAKAIADFDEMNSYFTVFADNESVAKLASADEGVRGPARAEWNEAASRMKAVLADFRSLRPSAELRGVHDRLLKFADFSEKYFAAVAAVVAKVDAGAGAEGVAVDIGAINTLKQEWWASQDVVAANAALEEIKTAK